MRYELYKIQNNINKKIYIGITTASWIRRCSKHKSEARNGGEFKLHRAIRKYGEANFSFNLLETCSSIEELKERETYWISTLKTMDDNFGYNMTEGGDGTFGRLHSDTTKKKQSEKAFETNSRRHIKIEAISLVDNESLIFKTNREAAKFFNVRELNLSVNLKKENYSIVKDDIEWILSKRDDLRPEPRSKRIKRDPEQVKQHMLKMQKLSSEFRKDNKEFSEKMKDANLRIGKTRIIQQFKDGVLIAEYNGSRDVIAKNEGYSRSGVQHSLKGRTSNYQGFIWKYKN